MSFSTVNAITVPSYTVDRDDIRISKSVPTTTPTAANSASQHLLTVGPGVWRLMMNGQRRVDSNDGDTTFPLQSRLRILTQSTLWKEVYLDMEYFTGRKSEMMNDFNGELLKIVNEGTIVNIQHLTHQINPLTFDHYIANWHVYLIRQGDFE